MSVVFVKLAGAVAEQPIYVNLDDISRIEGNILYLRSGRVFELREGTVEAMVDLLPRVKPNHDVAAVFLEVRHPMKATPCGVS